MYASIKSCTLGYWLALFLWYSKASYSAWSLSISFCISVSLGWVSVSSNHSIVSLPLTVNFALGFKLKIASKVQKVVIDGSGVDINYFNYEPLKNHDITFLLIARLATA